MKKALLALIVTTLLGAQATPWMPAKPAKVPVKPTTSAPATDAAAGQVWVKTSDGSLHYVNPSGVDAELGSTVAPSPGSINYTEAGGGTALTLQATLDLNGVHPEAFGATGDATADDTTALTNANTYAAAQGKPLLLTKLYKITTDLTLTAPVVFRSGSYITVATTKTVTYSAGVVAAPNAYIFRGAGVHRPKQTPVAYIEWWGAIGDSAAGNSYVGTNCTAALQAAIDATVAKGPRIQLLRGGYYVNATITLPDQTTNAYDSFSLWGTNSNQNSGLARGDCFIEFDSTALFATKTVFVTTATAIHCDIRNICFFNHNGAATPTMFANCNFQTSTFKDNLVCRFGTIWNMWSGVNNIEGNHFIGMKDSTMNQLNSNYPADTWFRHNYVSGDNTLGTVTHIKIYSSASIHICDNYFDYAKIGIHLYYSGGSTAGKAEIRGNTLDILYRAIYIQQSSEVSITSNVFRRCNLASRAGFMPNNPNAAWACIEITTNSYNVTAVGNNYSDSDAFILLTGSGIWNVTECANVGNIASWPMIDWTAKTYDTVTYPLDGQRIQSLSRGVVRLTKSGNYTLLPSDDYVVQTSASASAFTLPSAYLGRIYRIKVTGAGTLTFTPQSGDTIDTATLATGGHVTLISSGTVWETN